jgi:hypothetical protein
MNVRIVGYVAPKIGTCWFQNYLFGLVGKNLGLSPTRIPKAAWRAVYQCWSESEDERPIFKDLAAIFEEIETLVEKSEDSVEMELPFDLMKSDRIHQSGSGEYEKPSESKV